MYLPHPSSIATAEMKNVILRHIWDEVKCSLFVAISFVIIMVLITFWMNHWEKHWHVCSPNFRKYILFFSPLDLNILLGLLQEGNIINNFIRSHRQKVERTHTCPKRVWKLWYDKVNNLWNYFFEYISLVPSTVNFSALKHDNRIL